MGIEIAEKFYGKDVLEEIRSMLPDLEENEDYWWNRGKCVHNGCEKRALSFSKTCWEHMSEGERGKFRKQLESNYASGKILRAINLQGVCLDRVVLAGGRLDWANLSGATLWVANLSFAHLREANLSGANLRQANLSGADLREANLSGADLWGANLAGAIVNSADLKGADLSYARVGKHVVYDSVDIEAYMNSIASRESEDIKKFLIKLERVEQVICKPSDNIKVTNFKGVKYNPHTRLYFHLYACLKWLPYYIRCIFKGEKVDKKRLIGPYRQTKLIGIDTTDLDWSKHPQLIRDTHYQQFLHSFKNRSWFNKYLLYPLWSILNYHGESIFIWLFWMIFSIAIFGYIFSCNPDFILSNTSAFFNSFEPYFASGSIFTSLGLSVRYEPHILLGQIVVLIEIIWGYIMLGVLISFFANKFVRRD